MTSTASTTGVGVRRVGPLAVAGLLLAASLAAPVPAAAAPTASPRLKVTQSVDRTSYDRAGQVLTWTSTVTNFGDVTLRDLEVVDSVAGVATRACTPVAVGGTLAPGASTTCTATLTLRQADLDARSSTSDTVTASATTSASDGGVKASASATASASSTATAGLSVSASTDPTTVTHVTQQVGYAVVVRNDGRLTLRDLLVSAPFGGLSALACSPVAQGGALAPGRTTTCSATRTLGLAELGHATLADTVRAEALTTTGTRVTGSGPDEVALAAPGPVAAAEFADAVAGGDSVTLPGATTARPAEAGAPAVEVSRTVFVGADDKAPFFGKEAHTAHADWTILPDGTIRVHPAPQYYGTGGDGVDYRVYDAAGRSTTAHLHVTVKAGAVAGAQPAVTVAQGQALTVDVLSHDDPGLDPDGSPGAFVGASLRLTGLSWGENGDWSRPPVEYLDHGRRIRLIGIGDYTAGADGRITFTATPTWAGEIPGVIYTVTTEAGSPETNVLDVTVSGTWHAGPGPALLATDDHAVTIRRQPVWLAGQANDDGLRMDGTTFPADQLDHLPAGSKLVGTFELDVAGEGTYSIENLEGIRFVPDAGFRGSQTTPVRYEISDWAGATSQATLTVTVLQGAVSHPDTATTTQGRPVTVDVRTNDDLGPSLSDEPLTRSDVGSVRFTTTSQPAGSTLGRWGSTLTVPGQGEYRVDPGTGTITFTPDGHFSGTASPVNAATTVATEHGAVGGPVQTIVEKLQVAVSAVVPQARADSASTTGRPVVLDPLANDTAGSSAVPLVRSSVRIRPTGLPSGAVLSSDGTQLLLPHVGALLVAGTGELTAVPLDGATGAWPRITYDVADTNGTRTSATVAVTVA